MNGSFLEIGLEPTQMQRRSASRLFSFKRTVPLLAAIVGNVVVATLGAARHMLAKRLGPVGFNRRHHFQLGEADMSHIGLPPRRAVCAEYVSDLQLGPGHGPWAVL